MTNITRKATGTETLRISNCPVCNSEVQVRDYGYTTFNPGIAICQGCKRKWKFDLVEDQWDAGKKWNKRASEIRRDLEAFKLLKVSRGSSISRNYQREALEDYAEMILDGLRKDIIGNEK